MKIAIRGGHNYGVIGSRGLIDEVVEDRKVKDDVIKYLKQLGHEVLDVTPERTTTVGQDLTYGVSRANSWNADYFLSIHFNAFNKRAKGVEVLYKSSKGKEYAERIVSNLASLGFVNRKAKADVRNLYEFNHCRMVNNIVEVCFVDNQEDVNLYRKVGVDSIAKAIAEGITQQKVVIESTTTKEQATISYCLEFQHFYNTTTKTSAPIKQDNIYGLNTEKAFQVLSQYIKGEKKSSTNYCLEFQKFFNKVVANATSRITEDGIYGNQTAKALEILHTIIKKF